MSHSTVKGKTESEGGRQRVREGDRETGREEREHQRETLEKLGDSHYLLADGDRLGLQRFHIEMRYLRNMEN